MLFTVNRHNGIPAYRQIIEQIRLGIAGGLLQVGAEVPSTRALSAQIGTNPMTVSKAYGILEREGVLHRRPGLPLVVAAGAGGDGSKETREMREQEFNRALQPAAKIAVQLGVSITRAKQLLSEAMNTASKDATD
ncbi:MAG: GntR family transcriptional regulator [Planctomycetota bacterium]|jgi:GntR family transcriptional regulator